MTDLGATDRYAAHLPDNHTPATRRSLWSDSRPDRSR